MTQPMFDKIALIGIGLIGGSIARDARKRGLAKHIVAAYAFELGKVETPEIRARVVDQLNFVDHDLASQVAGKLGLPEPAEEPVDDKMAASPALSQLNTARQLGMPRALALFTQSV